MARAKIRIGMVRCDGHTYTYGPLMAKCDVEVYRKNFFCEFFYMISAINNPDRLRTPIVPGFEIVKLWDKDPQAARGISDLFFGKPKICTRLEEVSEDIDAVFISDCGGNGSDHLQLATPFLKKGIPTFVDKPFANTLKDAKSIVALARKHNAPLFSASILTYVDEVANIRRRFQEIRKPIWFGAIKGVSISGPENLGCIIHGIGLALGVFGFGVESVECMGASPLEYILMHYTNDLNVIVMNTPKVFDGFFCEAYSKQEDLPPYPGSLRSRPVGDPEYVGGALNILKLFRKMVLTGKSPVTHEMLIEKIAIVEAARTAQKTRKRTYLKDIL